MTLDEMLDGTEMRIRHVRAGEHAALRRIRLESLTADPAAFAATYAHDAARPPEWWRWWATQSEEGSTQRTFVLVDAEDRWLGIALVRRDAERPDAAVLNAMWVAPEARGQGAVGRLCDACAGWAAERGLRELTLTVREDNARARQAYEGAGFVVRGPTSWPRHDRTLDEVISERQPTPRADTGKPELLMARPLGE